MTVSYEASILGKCRGLFSVSTKVVFQMPTRFALNEYRRLRGLGERANVALRSAKIKDEFSYLESLGLVRLIVKPDEFSDLSYLDQEMFADVRQKELDRAERDGTCGIVSQYRVSDDDDWQEADSVWGFIGDDWKDSGYDSDLMDSAIQAYYSANLSSVPQL